MPDRPTLRLPGLGAIQVAPQGLLGFFQLKQGGDNPKQLRGDLSGEVELLDWYTETNQEFYTNTAVVVTTIGSSGLFAGGAVVPAGEYWYVHNYDVLCQCAATVVARAAASVQFGPNDNTRIFILGDYQTGGAAAPEEFRVMSNRKFFLEPQSLLSIHIASKTAGNVTCTPYLRFTRLPV